jgi:hypothetical protein
VRWTPISCTNGSEAISRNALRDERRHAIGTGAVRLLALDAFVRRVGIYPEVQQVDHHDR